MDKFDVVVIGSGPGGYVCAIRCAQLGMKTAIVEKYNSLGGTCLNVGCIPSKALLDSSEHYHNAVHRFKTHGINTTGLKVDFKQMTDRKNEVVKQTVAGVEFLMKKNKITVVNGMASFISKNELEVKDDKGKTSKIETNKVVIATGSKPNFFPGMEPDKKRIITSTEALSLTEIPKHMIIIGGGVIGLELGSVYARLGSQVSVVEFMDSIIPTMDGTLRKELQRVLKKEGFKFYLGHQVEGVSSKGKTVTLKAKDKKGKALELKGDYCLVSVGRKPFTSGLKLDKAGVKTDDLGRI